MERLYARYLRERDSRSKLQADGDKLDDEPIETPTPTDIVSFLTRRMLQLHQDVAHYNNLLRIYTSILQNVCEVFDDPRLNTSHERQMVVEALDELMLTFGNVDRPMRFDQLPYLAQRLAAPNV